MAESKQQPDTASVEDAKKSAGVEPSGYKGDNPGTAGPGNTGIRSATPENSTGKINPSAPGDTGTTPNSNAQ